MFYVKKISVSAEKGSSMVKILVANDISSTNNFRE